ncbi:hypothetical protein [Spirilliplanes yamanashiensis]|uniref:Uncharacterized protein n=1 Tax=Spirilliplanes yamanashiensis TaxID=42233 RepID=A0A8J3Y6S1_9ACTN|nr:hypothetical protein [Spirilliplanes yamanashiensis]MDP9814931.1 hypothetical protein [Spirilliplanes yamanashiensis]GIJ02585.1 hypothetical protein Sya03_19370 [Spirilliplanes yamanashiensis]
MPVPPALRARTEDPSFWSALLLRDGDLGGDLRISLPVAAGYGLVLDLAGSDQALGLREPHAHEPVQLGWAAPGRAHPAVLSFADLELCGRVIALDDPTLPHPGLPVALLARFAPDASPGARATLEAAYRSLRRPVPEVPGPEQAPLPLFADERWWPRPPSDRVLTEGDIAALVTLSGAAAAAPSRSFLVRAARERLARTAREPWCDPATVAAADRLTGTGDLGTAGAVLAALERAGCDHPTVLDAFTEPVVPAEACWMAETLTGAAPGAALDRWLHAPGPTGSPLG